MSTITGTVSNGVTLGQAGYTSPLTITTSGNVSNNSGPAVYAGGTYANPVVVNQGILLDTGSSYAVELKDGGSVTNTGTGAVIQNLFANSGATGVYIGGGVGAVTNSGTISAAGGYGVHLADGGSVTNTGTGALITGNNGVSLGNGGGAGTVMNSGTITGSFGYGVVLPVGGTVVDSGAISGTKGAILAATLLLSLEHGYSLTGGISLISGPANLLQLSGAAGALTVDFNAVGQGFTNFGTVAFGTAAGSDETLTITDTTSLPGAISGFTQFHDIVDLTQLSPDGAVANLNTATDQLVVSNTSGQSVSLQLDPSENYAGTAWQTGTDGGTGTNITAACFLRGTLILTDEGEFGVENLKIADRVVTTSGDSKPIKWIGRRAYDPRFVAGNPAVLPIQIMAGALAKRIPSHDLRVSPEHCLVIDELFLPARALVNGATIVQCDSVERLEYFHLELDCHDVIFAEGAAVETFIDVGGRGQFQNATEFNEFYPNTAAAEWEPYAALLDSGKAALPAIRAAVLQRAESLGRVSRDPDLHLVVDGAIVRALSVAEYVYRFDVPAGAREVLLASRSVVPAETEAASLDPRRLGVPLERMVLRGSGLRIEITHDSERLSAGFHIDEISHRWTDGFGALPPEFLAYFAGEITIEVQIGAVNLHYPTDASSDHHLAAQQPTTSSERLPRPRRYV